jgi:hypothetical protein
MRLSIDITPEQHQCLKAAAALQGKSIKSYVLERSLPKNESENTDLQALETLLKSRIEAAENGNISTKSVDDIVNEVLQTESMS